MASFSEPLTVFLLTLLMILSVYWQLYSIIPTNLLFSTLFSQMSANESLTLIPFSPANLTMLLFSFTFEPTLSIIAWLTLVLMELLFSSASDEDISTP